MAKSTFEHYHRITAYDRHAMTPHTLDWEAQPVPYKTYPELQDKGVDLPDIKEVSDKSFRALLSASASEIKPKPVPDLLQLSMICFLANGLTGRTVHGNSHFYYRSSPSAGALYPNELYLAWFRDHPLDPGIYHLSLTNRRLTRLRSGNFYSLFQNFKTKTARDLSGVFLMSGIFFRSAWKYRNRAYRYLLLDGGHLIESARLALAESGFSAAIEYDFDDTLMNRLIGVDETREGCLALIGINDLIETQTRPETGAGEDLLPLPSQTVMQRSRVSEKEITYKDIKKIHIESSQLPASASQVPVIGPVELGITATPLYPIESIDDNAGSLFRMSYHEAVIRRRSRRNFVPDPLSFSQFSALLDTIRLTAYPETGFELSVAASRTVQTGFLVHQVEGIDSGFYLIDPVQRNYSLSKSSDLIPQMTDACLNQEWLKHASLHFLFMTNLKTIDLHFGPRGYRYAMMTAGRLGHMIYLTATALGLGCCGIGAFYDKEAEALLGLNEFATLLYLVAAGRTK